MVTTAMITPSPVNLTDTALKKNSTHKNQNLPPDSITRDKQKFARKNFGLQLAANSRFANPAEMILY